MEQTLNTTPNTTKNKNTVIVFIVLAMAFLLINTALCFVVYIPVYENEIVTSYEQIIEVPQLKIWLYALLDFVPMILLLYYVKSCFGQNKYKALVVAVFGAKALDYILAVIYTIKHLIELTSDLKIESYDNTALITSSIITYLLPVLSWVIVAITTAKGALSKILLYIALATDALEAIFTVLSGVPELFSSAGFIIGLFRFASFITSAGYICFFAWALLLFVKIPNPSIIKNNTKARKELKMNKQNGTEYLNKLYSAGEITQQEYAERHWALINKRH